MAAGTAGLTLMEAAGRAVAAAAAELGGAGAAVAVACGPGNNGGDGLVAARVLREQGHTVRVGLLGSPAAVRGDAAVMAERWAQCSGGAIEALSPTTLAGADVIIDAMFGAGLSRALDGVAAEVVAAINRAGKPVVAVDVPSGLDGTTGQAAGPVVQASATVTFFRLKPGHLLLPGRLLCGEARVADIGIPAGVREIAPKTWPTVRRRGLRTTRGRSSSAQIHARSRHRRLRPGGKYRGSAHGGVRRCASARPRHDRAAPLPPPSMPRTPPP
jgi:hydroxyethylthiazole kinase-like uncharacterized protein yjeF